LSIPRPPEQQGLGKTKGDRNSKLNCGVNRNGRPLSFVFMARNRHEITTTKECFESFAKSVVLADKECDRGALGQVIYDRGGVLMISPSL